MDKTLEHEASSSNDEAGIPEQMELPLVGDYVGIGGPDAVPLETEGPFEKPSQVKKIVY